MLRALAMHRRVSGERASIRNCPSAIGIHVDYLLLSFQYWSLRITLFCSKTIRINNYYYIYL
jgi:hypothetical protein